MLQESRTSFHYWPSTVEEKLVLHTRLLEAASLIPNSMVFPMRETLSQGLHLLLFKLPNY